MTPLVKNSSAARLPRLQRLLNLRFWHKSYAVESTAFSTSAACVLFVSDRRAFVDVSYCASILKFCVSRMLLVVQLQLELNVTCIGCIRLPVL
jgi:hypothetical protein